MDIVSELEKAANILMGHPGLVTSEERHNAERLFLEFRKTKKPYDICQNILKSCKVDYVLFEAATTLKEAVIREWAFLEKEEINALCSFLLQFTTERTDFPNFVREQILLVVAVIFKLGTLETPDARTSLISGLTSLVSSGNKNMELVCCSIIKALLTEYSTSSQSTNFGMSLDFHAKCKKAFEEKDLLNIFMLTVNSLQKYSGASLNQLSREDIAVFNRYLSLAEQILLWEFMSGNPLSLLRFPTLNETAQKILFKPHKNWKDVMLNPNLVELYFKLLQVTLSHDELSHHCMQCLTQLASVAGAVFGSDEIQQKYLSHFIKCLLSVVDCHRWSAHQALCLSNIIFRLVDVTPIKILKIIQEDILRSLFKAMTFLTCTFQEQAVKVGQNDIDDNEYAEASNLLLDSWITVTSHAEDFPADLFKQHGLNIVETYFKCHLAAPDGIRSEAETTSMGEIDHDIEESDRDAYSDELSNIGHFARMCLPEVVPVLVEKLSVRNVHLQELFNHEKHRHNGNGTGQVSTDVLFEDMHWLILISTYILTIDATGESDQVPGEIIDCSNSYLTSHPHCISNSVKYLMTIGKEGDANNVDPTIALFTNVLRTAQIEMEFLQNNLTQSFSPEVCSTFLWFFKRFARGYLGGSSSSQVKTSPCLNACFDLNGDCGQFVMKLLLDSAEQNVMRWNSEPQVSEDVSQLLLRIFGDKERVTVALSMPNVWSISKEFSTHNSKLHSLPPAVQRNLVEGLMKACMEVRDLAAKEQLKNQLLKPIMDNYQKVRCAANFKSISQKPQVKCIVIRTFECLRGVFPSCFASFADSLFQYFLPIIEDTVNLLEIYDNYADIVNSILEMYVDIMEFILCFLNQENSSLLCKICIEMMKKYSKFNLRKKMNESEEEDQFLDLLLLIRLLSHILSKEYLNLGDTDTNNSTQMISPVEVVLYGVQIIIPLITQEILKYPNLGNEYFKLVTFICEVYPEKIKALPVELFGHLMMSVQMAISEFGEDIAKCGLDALSSLAKYLHNECERNDPINSQLVNALQGFLNIIFQHIVLGHFNMELIEPAAECLFLLICCHQDEYLKLANNLIANQHVTDENFKERLTSAFQVLTPAGLQLTPNRQSLKQFRKNLEVFLQSVKGFLCFK